MYVVFFPLILAKMYHKSMHIFLISLAMAHLKAADIIKNLDKSSDMPVSSGNKLYMIKR